MRAILILCLSFAAFGCLERPHLDLGEPVWFVADESFYLGCDNDPAGYMACYAVRNHLIHQGVNEWFEYFPEANRPVALILWPEENVPNGAANELIRLKIEKGACDKPDDPHPACYRWSQDSRGRNRPPEIIFDHPDAINPSMVAHEFGHALGRDDNDVPEWQYSVMSYTRPFYVAPVDIDLLCALHPEVECPPHVWCVDVDDLCRCPSDSVEDGMAKFGAGLIVCR